MRIVEMEHWHTHVRVHTHKHAHTGADDSEKKAWNVPSAACTNTSSCLRGTVGRARALNLGPFVLSMRALTNQLLMRRVEAW